jgi:hypothetical protein
VNSSSIFRGILVVVLLLSVAWKIAVPPDDQDDLNYAFLEFFEHNHFNVMVTDQVVNDAPVIRANKASCRLQTAKLTPGGAGGELVRSLDTGADRFFVVFRGRVYAQQPVLWTVLDYSWSRFLRELGMIKHITPIIAVTANSACDTERIPWDELTAASKNDGLLC